MRKIGGVWYNLDSYLSEPMTFQEADEVRGFLDYIIGQDGKLCLSRMRKNEFSLVLCRDRTLYISISL